MKIIHHIFAKILAWFKPKPSPEEDQFLGYWGVWDTTTDETCIKGEMYVHQGEWIPGPEIYKKEDDIDFNKNEIK